MCNSPDVSSCVFSSKPAFSHCLVPKCQNKIEITTDVYGDPILSPTQESTVAADSGSSCRGNATHYIGLREWHTRFPGYISDAFAGVASTNGPHHSSRGLRKYGQCRAAYQKASNPGARRLPFSQSVGVVHGTYWQLPDICHCPTKSREPENRGDYR